MKACAGEEMFLLLGITLMFMFGNYEYVWASAESAGDVETYLTSASEEISTTTTTEFPIGQFEISTHVVSETIHSLRVNDSSNDNHDHGADCDHGDHNTCHDDDHENHNDHDENHNDHDDHDENHNDHDDHDGNHNDHYDHDGNHNAHDENNNDLHDHGENHNHEHGNDHDGHDHLHFGIANSLTEVIISAFIIILTSIVGTICNCLLVIAILMTKKLRTPSGFVILMLSFNDLVLCLFTYPILAYGSVEQQNTIQSLCAITALIIPISYFVRIFAFPIIAFNRYLLITKSSSKYQLVFTKSKTVILIAVCYAIPIFLYLLPLAFTEKFHIDFSDVYDACVIHNLIEHLPEVEFSVFILCFVITVLSYLLILRHILAHVHDVEAIQAMSQIQSRKLSIQVAKMMAAVSVGFFVSVFPYLCMRIIDADLNKMSPIIHKSSLIILVIGSMVNPVLFTLTNEWHRKTVKALITLRKPTNVIPLTVKTA